MKKLNEILSISNEILEKTTVIHSKIENDKREINEDYAGTYYEGKFNENIFGLDFTIQYRYYITLKNYDVLHGRTVIKKRLMELIVYNSFKTFDNILIHELLHIYQYVKNKIDYDKHGSNKELYKIAGKILGNDEYSDIEKTYAGALYLTFPYEQDAMVHGLYKILDNFPSMMVNRVLKDTDEYLFLEDLKYAIDNIDNFDESLFTNLLTKNKFLNMCKKSYKRYKTKIEHVVQHIIDDKSKLNEGLVHFIPSHHYKKDKKNNKQ